MFTTEAKALARRSAGNSFALTPLEQIVQTHSLPMHANTPSSSPKEARRTCRAARAKKQTGAKFIYFVTGELLGRQRRIGLSKKLFVRGGKCGCDASDMFLPCADGTERHVATEQPRPAGRAQRERTFAIKKNGELA